MAITSGFFNSFEGDRRYDAIQFGSVFDGLITDGIFATIGTAFACNASTGMDVLVGEGKAWFDHTWTKNDAIFVVPIPASETLLDRIDSIVLDINNEDGTRANNILLVKGDPSSQPVPPTLLSDYGHHSQYRLCNIRVAHGVVSIGQADITNLIGLETPFVTGIVDVIDAATLFGQWAANLNRLMQQIESDADNMESSWQAWFANWQTEISGWETSSKTEFEIWFNSVRDELAQVDVGDLLVQIQNNNQRDFLRYYDLVDKTTTINKTSDGVTESIVEVVTDGTLTPKLAATATTTFEVLTDGKNIITNVVPEEGEFNYRKIVSISTIQNEGKSITESYERVAKE